MAGKVKNMQAREKRKVRIRKTLKGTSERPRLNVFRSGRHIYAQIIDDSDSKTLLCASTLTGDLSAKTSKMNKTDAAKKVGELIGKLAKEKGISKVVFDRGGYLYHGRVKALADGAREAGLDF
ncbi:MAG: 50S ribosomal protein L18 [Thermodesulfobacteriota bacterium]